eukprot:TRINITY_DN3353_c0_g1_i5.p1 TRINITY_DN3353_c0_g1~~TRINITY_DN3353_c0_g1_i5.p1  ORF type:complete len:3044 (-),score=294.67 TRINITY_DN3353_c0_g1_i5:116-8077(-)
MIVNVDVGSALDQNDLASFTVAFPGSWDGRLYSASPGILYYIKFTAVNFAGGTAEAHLPPVLIDTTAPRCVFESTKPDHVVEEPISIGWNCEETESPETLSFEISIVESLKGAPVFPWIRVRGTRFVASLALSVGTMYTFQLTSQSAGGRSHFAFNFTAISDAPLSGEVFIGDVPQSLNQLESCTSVTAWWSGFRGALTVEVALGQTSSDDTVPFARVPTTSNSVTFPNLGLVPGRPYRVTVRAGIDRANMRISVSDAFYCTTGVVSYPAALRVNVSARTNSANSTSIVQSWDRISLRWTGFDDPALRTVEQYFVITDFLSLSLPGRSSSMELTGLPLSDTEPTWISVCAVFLQPQRPQQCTSVAVLAAGVTTQSWELVQHIFIATAGTVPLQLPEWTNQCPVRIGLIEEGLIVAELPPGSGATEVKVPAATHGRTLFVSSLCPGYAAIPLSVITVDTTPPDLAVFSPIEGLLSVPSVTVHFAAFDAESGILQRKVCFGSEPGASDIEDCVPVSENVTIFTLSVQTGTTIFVSVIVDNKAGQRTSLSRKLHFIFEPPVLLESGSAAFCSLTPDFIALRAPQFSAPQGVEAYRACTENGYCQTIPGPLVYLVANNAPLQEQITVQAVGMGGLMSPIASLTVILPRPPLYVSINGYDTKSSYDALYWNFTLSPEYHTEIGIFGSLGELVTGFESLSPEASAQNGVHGLFSSGIEYFARLRISICREQWQYQSEALFIDASGPETTSEVIVTEISQLDKLPAARASYSVNSNISCTASFLETEDTISGYTFRLASSALHNVSYSTISTTTPLVVFTAGVVPCAQSVTCCATAFTATWATTACSRSFSVSCEVPTFSAAVQTFYALPETALEISWPGFLDPTGIFAVEPSGVAAPLVQSISATRAVLVTPSKLGEFDVHVKVIAFSGQSSVLRVARVILLDTPAVRDVTLILASAHVIVDWNATVTGPSSTAVSIYFSGSPVVAVSAERSPVNVILPTLPQLRESVFACVSVRNAANTTVEACSAVSAWGGSPPVLLAPQKLSVLNFTGADWRGSYTLPRFFSAESPDLEINCTISGSEKYVVNRSLVNFVAPINSTLTLHCEACTEEGYCASVSEQVNLWDPSSLKPAVGPSGLLPPKAIVKLSWSLIDTSLPLSYFTGVGRRPCVADVSGWQAAGEVPFRHLSTSGFPAGVPLYFSVLAESDVGVGTTCSTSRSTVTLEAQPPLPGLVLDGLDWVDVDTVTEGQHFGFVFLPCADAVLHEYAVLEPRTLLVHASFTPLPANASSAEFYVQTLGMYYVVIRCTGSSGQQTLLSSDGFLVVEGIEPAIPEPSALHCSVAAQRLNFTLNGTNTESPDNFTQFNFTQEILPFCLFNSLDTMSLTVYVSSQVGAQNGNFAATQVEAPIEGICLSLGEEMAFNPEQTVCTPGPVPEVCRSRHPDQPTESWTFDIGWKLPATPWSSEAESGCFVTLFDGKQVTLVDPETFVTFGIASAKAVANHRWLAYTGDSGDVSVVALCHPFPVRNIPYSTALSVGGNTVFLANDSAVVEFNAQTGTIRDVPLDVDDVIAAAATNNLSVLIDSKDEICRLHTLALQEEVWVPDQALEIACTKTVAVRWPLLAIATPEGVHIYQRRASTWAPRATLAYYDVEALAWHDAFDWLMVGTTHSMLAVVCEASCTAVGRIDLGEETMISLVQHEALWFALVAGAEDQLVRAVSLCPPGWSRRPSLASGFECVPCPAGEWSRGLHADLCRNCTSYVQTSNATVSVDLELRGIAAQQGATMYACVKALFAATSSQEVCRPVTFDATAPDASNASVILPYYTSNTAAVQVDVTGFVDDETGILGCYAGLGTEPGASDASGGLHWIGLAASYMFTDLDLGHARQYWCIVVCLNQALLAANVTSNPLLVDLTPPVVVHCGDGLLDDADTQSFDDRLYCNWIVVDKESGTTLTFDMAIGTSPNGSDVSQGFVHAGDGNLFEFNATVLRGVKYYCTIIGCTDAGLCVRATSNGIELGEGQTAIAPDVERCSLFSITDEAVAQCVMMQRCGGAYGGVCFPPGVVNQSIIMATERITPSATDNFRFGNYSFYINAVQNGSVIHTDFQGAFYVTIRYPESMDNTVTPFLMLQECNDGVCQWKEVVDYCPPDRRNFTLDREARIVTFPVCHLTVFALAFESAALPSGEITIETSTGSRLGTMFPSNASYIIAASFGVESRITFLELVVHFKGTQVKHSVDFPIAPYRWNYSFDLAGEYQICISARNRLGLESSTCTTVIADATPPQFTDVLAIPSSLNGSVLRVVILLGPASDLETGVVSTLIAVDHRCGATNLTFRPFNASQKRLVEHVYLGSTIIWVRAWVRVINGAGQEITVGSLPVPVSRETPLPKLPCSCGVEACAPDSTVCDCVALDTCQQKPAVFLLPGTAEPVSATAGTETHFELAVDATLVSLVQWELQTSITTLSLVGSDTMGVVFLAPNVTFTLIARLTFTNGTVTTYSQHVASRICTNCQPCFGCPFSYCDALGKCACNPAKMNCPVQCECNGHGACMSWLGICGCHHPYSGATCSSVCGAPLVDPRDEATKEKKKVNIVGAIAVALAAILAAVLLVLLCGCALRAFAKKKYREIDRTPELHYGTTSAAFVNSDSEDLKLHELHDAALTNSPN